MRIEEKVQSRARRQRIQNIVLGSLYATGALGMIAVAPNSAQLLRYVEKYIGPKPKLNRRISQAVTRLRQRGLIEKGDDALRLSDKGRRLAESLELEGSQRIRKPRRW